MKKSKFAFVHIPKTAGSSIRDWFLSNNLKNNFVGKKHFLLKDIIQDYGPVDFSFTCVRNIYDKLISFYHWQGPKTEKRHLKSLKRNGHSDYTDEYNCYKKGLIDYIVWAKSTENLMVLSQVEWITGVEYIMYFDNLDNDFKKIQSITGCSNPLKKIKNVRTYNPQPFFTKDYIETVKKYFADEIEYFNWSPKFE